MSADLNVIPKMKQLKKACFLAIVPTEDPITRGGLVDMLDEYDFIESWLTFLIEHFIAQNKIVESETEGGVKMYVRKAAKGGAAPGKVYSVEFDEDLNDGEGSYAIISRTLEKGETMDKENGERTTPNAAVKAATSAVFAQYKADTAAIKAVLVKEEADTDGESEAK